MNVKEFVRKEVFELPFYEVESVTGQNEQVVKLDLNENFAVEGDEVEKLLLNACQDLDIRAYPPAYGSMAVKALSSFLGFNESEIAVGNGEDEILDLLMKILVKENSLVITVEPTFTTYTYFAKLYGVRKATVLLKPNFELDVDKVLEQADRGKALLLICSPNNPTGNQFAREDVEKILQEFRGIVVIDEAYVDFAKYSIIDWVRNFDNLIVLRTFSKAFGLAGIRFGCLISNKTIVECVKRVTAPFNMNVVTQRMIVLALQNWKYFKERIQQVIKEREWLSQSMAEIDGIAPCVSDANFILFKITKDDLSSSTITRRLKSRNVLVKDRGDLPLLANCIRVAVGTRQMNQTFLTALRKALEE